MRLDYYYGHNGANVSPHGHGTEMIEKKLQMIDYEISEYLPSLAKKLQIDLEKSKPNEISLHKGQ